MSSEPQTPDSGPIDWDAALALIEELKSRARTLLAREGHGGSIKTTALVLSALRMMAGARKDWEGFDERRFDEVSWANKDQFFRYAFQAMRRALINAARTRARAREVQGGAFHSEDQAELVAAGVLPIERLAWETDGTAAEILELALAQLRDRYPAQRYADIWELKHHLELTQEEIGRWVGLSSRTIQDRLPMAQTLLKRIFLQLNGDSALDKQSL